MALSKIHEDTSFFNNSTSTRKYGWRHKPKKFLNDEDDVMIKTLQAMFPTLTVDHISNILQESHSKRDIDAIIDGAIEMAQKLWKVEDSLDSLGESCSSSMPSEDGTEVACNFSEPLSSEESDEEPLSDNEQKTKLLNVAKQVFREKVDSLQVICQYCHENNATILLLPCAHLACCKSCLRDVRRCPLDRCLKVVRGTKEVFFV